MNTIELHQAVRGKTGWSEFAGKLKTAIEKEFGLEDVTIVLREMTAEETADPEDHLFTFNQESQRFEFALAPDSKFPPAWKIADRIDCFLNPDAGGDG